MTEANQQAAQARGEWLRAMRGMDPLDALCEVRQALVDVGAELEQTGDFEHAIWATHQTLCAEISHIGKRMEHEMAMQAEFTRFRQALLLAKGKLGTLDPEMTQALRALGLA